MLDKIIKTLILDTIMSVVRDKLIMAIPWLGWPIISQVVGWAMMKVGGLIVDEMSRRYLFISVDAQVAAENQKYTQSVAQLQTAIAGGTDADIEAAKAAFKASLHDLIHMPS